MDSKTIQNILDELLTTLDEFKSEDIKHYEKQAFKIINYVKKLEKQKG